MSLFKSLNLAAPVHKALDRLDYTTPTPIQAKAIPDVLNGRDLMGIAQTGTGKTAAFSLPTLSHIANTPKDPPKRGARVLILAPTRELASQIAVSVRDYGVCMPELTVACIFGGVPIQRQIKKLVRGNDVLVATPGRLIDLMNRKDVRLNEIEILILDEADQMMDMGFIHALKQIVPHVPKDRQTLFFSATMTPQIKKLAAQFLTDPIHVSVAPPNTTAEKVEQSIIYVDKKEKQDLLSIKLLDSAIERALIFTRTKHGADRVVKRLAKVGIEAVAIHGNKSQGQRTRALTAFREAKVRFLVATDIAARGIDIEGITHVFNFEIPNVPEQYVHRIGRTGRAGREGRAIAFVDREERDYLKGIQKLLKTTIPVEALPENFNTKAAEVKKRAPLPKPDKPDATHKPRQDPRRKKFKKKKRDNNIEDRDTRKAENTKSKKRTNSERPKAETSQGAERPNRKKSWSKNRKQNDARREDSRTEKPNQGDRSHSHKKRPDTRKNHSQSNDQNKPQDGSRSQNNVNRKPFRKRASSDGRNDGNHPPKRKDSGAKGGNKGGQNGGGKAKFKRKPKPGGHQRSKPRPKS